MHNDLIVIVRRGTQRAFYTGGDLQENRDEENDVLGWQEDEDDGAEMNEVPEIRKTFSLHWRNKIISTVPEGFVLPGMTIANPITNWCNGNQSERITPYRFLKGSDFAEEERKKVSKTLLNKKRMMKLVEFCGKD